MSFVSLIKLKVRNVKYLSTYFITFNDLSFSGSLRHNERILSENVLFIYCYSRHFNSENFKLFEHLKLKREVSWIYKLPTHLKICTGYVS